MSPPSTLPSVASCIDTPASRSPNPVPPSPRVPRSSARTARRRVRPCRGRRPRLGIRARWPRTAPWPRSRPLRDDHPVAGAGHRRRDEPILGARGDADGAADHGPGAPVVPRRVARPTTANPISSHARWNASQSEASSSSVISGGRFRSTAITEAACRSLGVGREDVDREPCRPLPPVGGHDEDRVGRERHRDSVRHADDADVHAVPGPDQHVVVVPRRAARRITCSNSSAVTFPLRCSLIPALPPNGPRRPSGPPWRGRGPGAAPTADTTQIPAAPASSTSAAFQE